MNFDHWNSKLLKTLLTVAIIGAVTTPAYTQKVISEETTNAIVGSEIQQEEAGASADAAQIISAIEKTSVATETVRKTSNLSKVEIIFLADAAATEGGPPPEIAQKMEEHKTEIIELRKELEGNAMLFHAIDSKQILVQDVLGITFHDDQSATIYAATKPAG